MPLKLYAWTTQHFYLYCTLICAGLAGVEVEVVVPTKEEAEDKDFVAKKGHLNFPILELEDGKFLGEHIAICKYLLEMGGKTDMLGKGAFHAAQVEQWGHICSTSLTKPWLLFLYNVFGLHEDKVEWEESLAKFSAALPDIDSALAKGWLVGEEMSVADVLLFRIAFMLFSFLLGPEQRAQFPNFTAWFEKMYRHPAVVAVVGKYHMCAEPMKLHGSNAVVTAGAAVAKAPEAKKEASDDEMDLFGSDDEDEQIERMEAKVRIAEAKREAEGKKKKVGPVAKSNVLFEVKPFDSETDLDAVAAKIFAEIVMDGLLWKTEYKKDPVAFGIYKLIIGCTIEDEKVSSDDLQEQIEAFDELVQSVDIASFMKV